MSSTVPNLKSPKTWWCGQTLRIEVRRGGQQWEIETNTPFARIGSHYLSEVVLEDVGIPLQSHYLHATDGGVYCVPLAPESATSGHWLVAGESFSVGPFELRVSFQGGDLPDAPDHGPLDAVGSAGRPFPVYGILVGRDLIARCRQRRSLTIVGRDRPSTFRMHSETVSPVQCALYWDGTALWAIDLLSKEGTIRRGRRLDATQIRPRRSLMMGTVRLVFMRISYRLPGSMFPESPAPSNGARGETVVNTARTDSGILTESPRAVQEEASRFDLESCDSSPDLEGLDLQESLSDVDLSATALAERQQITELKDNVEAERQELIQEQRAMEEKWRSLEHEQETLRALHASLQEHSSSLVAADRALESKREAFTKERAETLDRIENKNRDLHDRDAALSEAESSLAGLKAQQAECDAAREAMIAQQNELERLQAELREQHESQRRDAEQLGKQLSELDQQFATLRQAKVELDAERDRWELERFSQQALERQPGLGQQLTESEFESPGEFDSNTSAESLGTTTVESGSQMIVSEGHVIDGEVSARDESTSRGFRNTADASDELAVPGTEERVHDSSQIAASLIADGSVVQANMLAPGMISRCPTEEERNVLVGLASLTRKSGRKRSRIMLMLMVIALIVVGCLAIGVYADQLLPWWSAMARKLGF